MTKQLIFEELGEKERTLLLRAFDFDVNKDGEILNPQGQRIASKENPKRFLKARFAALMPGSLEVIDGTPSSISEYLRTKNLEKNGS